MLMMWEQLKTLFANEVKEPWEMTQQQYIESVGAKHEELNVANIAVMPIGNFLVFPGEKITQEKNKAYRYVNKREKIFDFDFLTTQADLGRKRVLARYSGMETIAAGLIVNENGEVVNIYTNEPRIGLAQALLKEAERTIGKLKVPKESISVKGAKAAHRYFVSKAIGEGRDIPESVLKDYPDLVK